MRETMTSGTATRVFDFIYDESGKPFACKYTINGTTTTTMYYALNLQGDVVRIVNANGSTLVKYSYNAWGELLSVTNANDVAITSASHIGNLNPLRYRGYYYDSETGFYYLQSRYYDPVMHRFINADCYTDTGTGFLGYNMFSYCNNNPIAYRDDSGEALYPTTFTVRDGGATVNEDVVVISIIDEGWGESSQIMGESFAQSIGNGSARVVYVTSSNFLDVWSSISESYVIIHTHGSPNVLCGSDFKLTTEDVRNLSAKANIKGMLITACSTGGNNNDDPNIAQIFSKKIRIDGLVVCSTTTVGGGDTYFEAKYNGAWIIYRNAVFQNKRLPATISMQYVVKTVFDK